MVDVADEAIPLRPGSLGSRQAGPSSSTRRPHFHRRWRQKAVDDAQGRLESVRESLGMVYADVVARQVRSNRFSSGRPRRFRTDFEERTTATIKNWRSLLSGHLSTIACTIFKYRYDPIEYTREMIRVPDGGTIAVDFAPPIEKEDPLDARPILVVSQYVSLHSPLEKPNW